MKAALGESCAYDPLAAPDPQEWLATDEGERVALVRAFHRKAGLGLGTGRQDRLHATVHVIVENQIAMDVEGRRQQLASLIGRGMDRHDAVHELGKGVLGQVYDGLKGIEHPSPDSPKESPS